MKVSKYRKIVEFKKFQLKRKIVKHFTRPKQQAALKKLFSLPQTPIPPDKILISLWNKNLREIHRNIQTFAFKVLQESSCWVSGNGAGQMFFLTPNRNMFAKLYYKMSDLFSLVFIGFDIFWFQLLTCGFKLVTGAFELVTRWFELDL